MSLEYAEIAIHTPVRGVFTYHIPPHLAGKIDVGHLVRVAFGTAMQPGIVVRLSEWTELPQTKPIEARLDPEPILTLEQILIAEWMAERYLSPVGFALWSWLPAGLVGHSDQFITLKQPDFQSSNPLEQQIIALLAKRGGLRLRQMRQVIKNDAIEKLVKVMVTSGILDAEPVLSPPGVRPQSIQTAALAIHPATIPDVERFLGKKAELYLHILRVLARESEPVNVSWVYAQTGAKLPDLKRLAELDLVLLGEKHTWRDSLAERDFVPVNAPKLTEGQLRVWEKIYPSLTLPAGREGTGSPSSQAAHQSKAAKAHQGKIEGSDGHKVRSIPSTGEAGWGSARWHSPAYWWDKLKPLANQKRQQPTAAEERLWQYLRRQQLGEYKFRRQHVIERFIVDFYCHDARLIVEVDGEIHQYTQVEDAVRQEYLEALGFRVIRFTNQEVFQAIVQVLERILEALQNPSLELPGTSVDSNKAATRQQTEARLVKSNQPQISREPKADSKVESTPPPSTGEAGRGFSPTPSIFLLHGVTGSGKTEIYLRAIDETLNRGRQAIFLVPEIALTAQTIRRVAARFPGKVAVMHSRLSEGERYDTWRRCREGLVQVVVGTRSALFAPLPDVGCICIDEEHDDSYKNIASPHYDTREVAEYMMLRNNGILIMGSATPDLVTFTRAQDPDDPLTYLHLPDRIMGHRTRIIEQVEREGLSTRYHETVDDGEALTIELPPVTVVDLREELKAGNTSIFSRALRDALSATLDRNEQAILLLNRRGSSSYVFCRDCGFSLHCPRCDMPLTYHQYSTTLRCHHCGYEGENVSACPNCQSKRIKFFGAGTQQVEAEVQAQFPQARLIRWDSDTANRPEMHDAILLRFLDHQADVMVGTQLVAKGLDFPRVTLVGVISADIGLNLPDFRAGERTFQLLTQVAGRAGRALPGGQVILQTYQPEHYVIQAASKHDYAGFYAQELQYRRELGYPPFRRLARILFQHKREVTARDEAQRAFNILQHKIQTLGWTGTELIGPAPCFFSRVNDQYRWQLLIRGPNPALLLEDLEPARGWYIDLDPVDVL